MQARISELSASSDEESLESEDEEESVVDSSIEDGYYDEENKVTWHVEADGSMCPIPDGYVGSSVDGENEINMGYVIYEGEDEVTDENVAQAKTTRNQYVWIPVPDASQMYGTDSNGKKWGKLYDFSTSSGITAYNWSESDGGMKISSEVYMEPTAIRLGYDSTLITYDLGVETTHEFLIQLEKEFNEMIESVEKYGGFYIGRYETGNLSLATAVVIAENGDITYTTWYNSYKKCKTLAENKENIETGMIWGCQWYRTLIWLIESGNKTIEDICNSASWGNYADSTGNAATGSGSKRSTAYNEAWKTANIYDLAGNVQEWTMNSQYFGGQWNSNASVDSVNSRHIIGLSSFASYIGCRAMLYIK